MKKFYFIGGPKEGYVEEFFKRLANVGGTPSSWRIYPHANNDGKALHIMLVENESKILEHLNHFEDVYDRSEIIEIVDRQQ